MNAYIYIYTHMCVYTCILCVYVYYAIIIYDTNDNNKHGISDYCICIVR